MAVKIQVEVLWVVMRCRVAISEDPGLQLIP